MRLLERADERVRLLELGTGRGHVDLGLHPIERAGELERSAPRISHLDVRRHAQIEKEVGPVRRPRDPPPEAALDRTDVRDPAHVAVAHLLLPAR